MDTVGLNGSQDSPMFDKGRSFTHSAIGAVSKSDDKPFFQKSSQFFQVDDRDELSRTAKILLSNHEKNRNSSTPMRQWELRLGPVA